MNEISYHFLLGEDIDLLTTDIYGLNIQKFYGFIVGVSYWFVHSFALKISDINYTYGFMMNNHVGNFCLTFIAHS